MEEYHTSDIERELGMDRLGLICLALLLGSDYTEGVAGIGIVNAVEVRGFCPCSIRIPVMKALIVALPRCQCMMIYQRPIHCL